MKVEQPVCSCQRRRLRTECSAVEPVYIIMASKTTVRSTPFSKFPFLEFCSLFLIPLFFLIWENVISVQNVNLCSVYVLIFSFLAHIYI